MTDIKKASALVLHIQIRDNIKLTNAITSYTPQSTIPQLRHSPPYEKEAHTHSRGSTVTNPFNMVSKILFWGGLGGCERFKPREPFTDNCTGVAVRAWQLGIQMLPVFAPNRLWVYTVYAGFGGTFGYWLEGAEERHNRTLLERKRKLLEKRKRKEEADALQSEDDVSTPIIG